MRLIVALICSAGLAQAHLIESVPSSVSLKFKNGNAAVVTAKDERLESLEVTLNGRKIVMEKETLGNIPFPNLRSIHLLETDLDKVKRHFLSIRFGVAPDVHGSTMSDDDGHTVTFTFVEGQFSSKTVDHAESTSDPFSPPPIKALPERSGEQAGAEQPAIRPESDSEGGDKPQPEAEGRSR
jgi:hypothetical protein